MMGRRIALNNLDHKTCFFNCYIKYIVIRYVIPISNINCAIILSINVEITKNL